MKGLWFAFLCLFAQASEAKIYSKCEMYKELKKHGMEDYNKVGLGHWLCLILFSSGFNTEHYVYTEGQPYYGLFHLSGLIWCTDGRHNSQNICRIDCEQFLDDDITDDIKCAKIIARTSKGMLFWTRFYEYCTHPVPQILYWECV
ncbi:lysozyme C, milk isozyme-like [Pseudonaja textilis]|uniref:lysozyme C, milk isozyme-like n=1 Tax=Pseudonaja textilis TaxID=8673 RepID=UPI000EAA3A75|nr:lysozyme C, milk isozyme-like [Pseudonaja textilis]